MTNFPRDVKERIIPLRGLMGFCHLLIEENKKDAVLLDTGLYGELWVLKLALKKHGIKPENIKAILLTHGHLDHSGNLKAVQEMTGAKIYAHRLEQEIINGNFKYKGTNRWCGRLENIGRKLLGVGNPIKIDAEINDGDHLPFFGGLKTIHLPGHTLGHCGFYSERYSLLFSGDLFSSYPMFSHMPPPILNTAPELMLESMEKAWKLHAKYIIPQHYDFFYPIVHKKRFEDIFYSERAILTARNFRKLPKKTKHSTL
jgi:glyoxylase-like metal-dependent hydrolase (beta-lactamase superfamily II)